MSTALDHAIARTVAAEKSVLGAVLLDATRLDEARGLLTAEDFFRDAHRRIFAAMGRLADAGRAIDTATLFDALSKAGELEEVGGLAYVAGLVDGVPRAANLAHYAAMVRAYATTRAVVALCRQGEAKAEAGEEEPEALLAWLERELTTLTGRSTALPVQSPAQRAEAARRYLEEVAQGQTRHGVATGIRALDERIRGLQAGHLVVVAARPGMGKTAWLLTAASAAAADARKPALVFSVEMGAEEINLREIALRGALDSRRIQAGHLNPPEWAKADEAVEGISEGGVHLVDAPVLTVREIRHLARRTQQAHGLAFIGVDYLQLLTPERSRGTSAETRTLEIAAMTRALKALARELGVPVVLLSQLSRGVESRSDKRPMLSDLRDSGAIEQDSDVVLFLYRPWVYDRHEPESLAEIIVAKQRSGPVGIVKAAFFAAQTRFADWSERVA